MHDGLFMLQCIFVVPSILLVPCSVWLHLFCSAPVTMFNTHLLFTVTPHESAVQWYAANYDVRYCKCQTALLPFVVRHCCNIRVVYNQTTLSAIMTPKLLSCYTSVCLSLEFGW